VNTPRQQIQRVARPDSIATPEGGVTRLRRRSFAPRYLTLFGGEAFSKLCVLAAFAYLARVVGPREFGIIELALSITIFFVLSAENGLGSYGARLVARSRKATAQVVPQVMLLRLFLAVPCYLVMLLGSYWYGIAGPGIVAVYGLVVLVTPLFTQWVSQGLRQMHLVAMGSALRNFLFVTLVLLFVRPGSDTRLVAAAEVCGAMALGVFNTYVLFRVLKVRLEWRGALGGAVRLLRDTWYMGASDITWACLWYSPSVIVGAMGLAAAEHVAWLAAAVRIVVALHSFVWLYFFNMLPNLSRELSIGLDEWRDLVRRSLSTSMWPAFLVALGGTLGAPLIVTILYGSAYEPAVRPLQIVVWMIPVTWFSGHFRFTLLAAGQQRLEFFAAAASAAVMVPLAVVLVYHQGSTGAAVALLVGSVMNAWLALVAVRRNVGRSPALSAIAPALSTCVGCLALGAAAGLVAGTMAAAVVGCLAYTVVALSHDNELTRRTYAWLASRRSEAAVDPPSMGRTGT
jgi:polysaccharide transporter, PST family